MNWLLPFLLGVLVSGCDLASSPSFTSESEAELHRVVSTDEEVVATLTYFQYDVSEVQIRGGSLDVFDRSKEHAHFQPLSPGQFASIKSPEHLAKSVALKWLSPELLEVTYCGVEIINAATIVEVRDNSMVEISFRRHPKCQAIPPVLSEGS